MAISGLLKIRSATLRTAAFREGYSPLKRINAPAWGSRLTAASEARFIEGPPQISAILAKVSRSSRKKGGTAETLLRNLPVTELKLLAFFDKKIQCLCVN